MTLLFQSGKSGTRRAYLQAALALGTSLLGENARALLPPSRPQSRQGDLLYSGGSFRENNSAPQRFSLTRLDPHSGERTLIDSPFFPHALAFDPRKRQRALAFEKIGAGAAEFNLKTARMERPISPRAGKLFYGHGVFSPDGRLLYCTESSVDDGSGSIGIFDGLTLQPLGEFPSHGLRPHECQLIEQGKTLVVTNGGGSYGSSDLGSLNWIDVRSGRLIKSAPILDPHFNAGHFQLHQRGAVVVSAPRNGLGASELGAVHAQTGDGTLVRLLPESLSTRLTGESLSVLIVPQFNTFLVTHPTPGLVTQWQLDNRQLQRVHELPKARGLALSADRQSIYVSYGAQADLASIALAQDHKLADAATALRSATLLAGSHLFNWPAADQVR